MMRPGKADFPLYRWAGPGQNTLVARFEGYDFSNAALKAEFRDYLDQSGTARISLINASASAQGVSCVLATENGVTVSYVRCRVNETTVENVAAAISSVPPQDGVYPLVWDLQINKVRWLEGHAPIYAGVTQ